MRVGVWYEAIMYMFPVLFAVLLGWALYQSITGDPSEWWVSGPVGVGLLLLQWGVVLAVIIYFNRAIARRFPEERAGFLTRRDRNQADRERVLGTTTYWRRGWDTLGEWARKGGPLSRFSTDGIEPEDRASRSGRGLGRSLEHDADGDDGEIPEAIHLEPRDE
jgi:hypothetical protein